MIMRPGVVTFPLHRFRPHPGSREPVSGGPLLVACPQLAGGLGPLGRTTRSRQSPRQVGQGDLTSYLACVALALRTPISNS